MTIAEVSPAALYYTRHETAARCRMSIQSLDRLTRKGIFPVEPTRFGRRILYPRKLIDALAAGASYTTDVSISRGA